MFIKWFLVIIYIFAFALGCLKGLGILKKQETEIINILIELIKVILPIFALISLFLPLDYNSFWFIVYVSIYYVLESVYNLLEKISLQDVHKNKFYPKVLRQKTNKMISAFTIVFALSFHLLLYNTIYNWFSHSVLINIISIIGILFLFIFLVPSVFVVLYDFYTIIEIPLFNNFINTIVKNIKKLTYKNLFKKIKLLDKFVYAYKPEIDTQFTIKSIKSALQFKYTPEQLNNTLSEKDQEFVIDILAKFQDSYLK